MAKTIEPKLKSINEYLKLEKSANFVIPEYQRPYSWDRTQCDNMWQDIEAFIESDGSDPYFFGTIIVDCSEDKDNNLNLIDGQQRTTTFFLLLKAMLIRLNKVISEIPHDDEETEALKAGLVGNRNKIMAILYKAEDEDIPEMLKNHNKIKKIPVLENKSNNELYKDEVKKIIEAVNYEDAEQNVHKIPRKQKDNKYTNHFRNFKYFYGKLNEKPVLQLNKFAKIFLEKCQVIEIRSWQIEQAFTMFNSLNSKMMPLSDADIVSAQLYSKAKASGDESKFNKLWSDIKKKTNDLEAQKIVDINAVLTQFMYINRACQKEYLRDGSFDVTVPGVRRYYTDINKKILDEPLVLCNALMKITVKWDTIKDYPIVKLLAKFNSNAKFYLAGYLCRFEVSEITIENVLGVCECLLRLFAILELVDAGYSSTGFKTFLFGENIKFVDKNISADEITRDFNEHIRNRWKKDDIMEAIIEYEKNILVYLNEYLYAKNNGGNFDFAENVNIEHIMPSSGKNTVSIRQDAGIADENEFNNIVNKLGNKILLEEDINKSIGNEWFQTKKQNTIKDKRGYRDSKYAIARALTEYPKNTWGKEDIETATEKVAKRITDFIFQDY